VSGCGWFGSVPEEQFLPSYAISDGSDPLSVRASYLAGSADYRFLSTAQLLSVTQAPVSVRTAVLERRYDGVIMRGVAQANTQGFTRPVLVRDPEAFEKDPANPVYLVRLTPPAGPSPVGYSVNREVIFAGFLSREEASRARSVTLVAAENRIRLRLR